MTAFRPISPSAALSMIETTDVDARIILADLAEAGLVKGYARLLKIAGPSGEREVRDSRLGQDIWSMIIAEGKVADVFSTNTVRLTRQRPEGPVNVTAIGIRFEEKSIAAAAAEHGFNLSLPAPTPAPANISSRAVAPQPDIETRSSPIRRQIPEGALQLTIADAMAILAIGKTTLYKLVGDGELVMKKTGGRSHITAESVRAYMNR
jgi:excisionase family DNA binding protein